MSDTFICGHPRTPENITFNGRRVFGRCKKCHNDQTKAAYHAAPKEVRSMQGRMRRLPDQIQTARKKLAMLENEARRYGMTDLLQGGDAR